MATVLTVSEQTLSVATITDSTTGITQQVGSGVGPMPDRTWVLTTGTGNGQGNTWYAAQRTVNNGANDDIDLSGVLTNPVAGTVSLTAVKRVLIRIVSPDGTKVLNVGPQGVVNAFAAPWGGTGATVYNTVYEELDLKNSFGGWAVANGSTDILRINNPGANPVTYFIWVIGK